MSELDSLMARLERAIAAIEHRQLTDAAASAELRRQQSADRARLAQLEGVASDTIAALDALIAGAR